MMRRRQFLSTPCFRGLSILLLFLLLVSSCFLLGPEPKGPEKLAAISSLQTAQGLFNEAVKSDQPTADVPAAARQNYQQVVDLVEKEVLSQSDASGKVSGYALMAFSQWRLGDCAKAMQAGEKGRQLYETAKLDQKRDYGMLLTVGGLCAASQTQKNALKLRNPTKEQVQKMTGDLEQAMQSINSVNDYLAPVDDRGGKPWEVSCCYPVQMGGS